MSTYPPLPVLPPITKVVPAPYDQPRRSTVGANGSRHLELLAALTLQISRGRPREAISLIDGLLINACERQHVQFMAELRTLRTVAELELCRVESAARNPRNSQGQQESVVATILDFMHRILPAIDQVALAGSNPVLSDQIVNELFHGSYLEHGRCRETPDLLSHREFQVLQLVAIGLSNQQVGFQLCISEGTVKKHLSNLLDKLEAGNRTQAVARARSLGIL